MSKIRPKKQRPYVKMTENTFNKEQQEKDQEMLPRFPNISPKF